jgi:hypothetical protein
MNYDWEKMCGCKRNKPCRYHWLNSKAVDWTELPDTNSALSDLMINYDAERVERMQAMHRMEEWYV